jgi:ribosomal protein L27
MLKRLFLTSFLILLISPTYAIEITPYYGQMFSDNLLKNSGEESNVSDDNSIGLGISWKDGPNGKGQILFNSSSHQFSIDENGQQGEFDVLYAHFNGIAEFRQQDYTTTVSIGVGATLVDVTHADNDIFPSITAALGTRYSLTKDLSLVTELRSYMSLTDEDNVVFCQSDDSCQAQFENTLWIETSVSVGLAYSF